MKAFLILVLLFLAFLLISSSSLANVDLTPNTPPGVAAGGVQPGAAFVPQNDIVVINGVVPAGQTNTSDIARIPVTGTCSNPYVVQPGDMLSGIAEICNTTVAAVRLANPQITNANLIYPGQQLAISGVGAAAQVPAQVIPAPTLANPVAAAPAITANQTVPNTAPNVDTTPEAINNPSATAQQALPQVPVSGSVPLLQAGTRLHVTANNYPPDTVVNVAVGPQTVGYNIVATGRTDANGSLTTIITIPAAPDATTQWVVVVATTTQPNIQAMSKPFLIAGQ